MDYGVENVSTCDAMVERQGENRGSFIAGSSHRIERIEHLWQDVFRCMASFFYYTFYSMEKNGLIDNENSIRMFTLHYMYYVVEFALRC